VAFFSLSTGNIDEAAQRSPARARIISRLLDRPKKLLATLLVANNLINITIVVIYFMVCSQLFDGIESDLLQFTVEVIAITFIILFFGEVLPKVYANRNNVGFALSVAYP